MHIKDVKSRQLTKIDFDGPVCVFLFVYMDNMYIATQLNLIDEFQFKGFFFWGGGGVDGDKGKKYDIVIQALFDINHLFLR